jgi:glycerophosphoryl diester phosphodiesterase
MKIRSILIVIISALYLTILSNCNNRGNGSGSTSLIKLPERGLCAHRGAMATHPENTLSAFREAIKAGAHMIEFDVFLTKDNEMVVIHDPTVDRTTNGSGRVADLTIKEIRELDAGSWKSSEFKGEKIPEFLEVLKIMPVNIWLNIHVKGEERLPVLVAETLAKEKRLLQSFMACSETAAKKAREIVPEIMICNMDRKESDQEYVNETIRMKADFIQLRDTICQDYKKYARELKEKGISVNYYGTDSPEDIKKLFDYGVDFPLVNDIINTIRVAEELNIKPVRAVYNINK